MAKKRGLTTPLALAGSSLSDPDLLYASGFMAPDPIVFIKHGQYKSLVVSSLEWGRARDVCKDRRIDVQTPAKLGLAGSDRRDLSAWIAAVLKKRNEHRLMVPHGFPYGLVRKLESRGMSVSLLEQAPFPSRRKKQPEEIACITSSQQAAVIAMRAAIAMITTAKIGHDGILYSEGACLTSEAVQRRIAEVLLRHDCHSSETIVACGPQGADPHERGHGPLKAFQPIVLDIFPRHHRHGYWGDITRTVVKGDPPVLLKKMYAAVKKAQVEALKSIRAGVRGKNVHEQAALVFEQTGFKTEFRDQSYCGFIHSTGHGVGLAIHEEPSLGGNDDILREGDVVTVEPGLYYPEWGGIRIEDTVLVTRSGWRLLAACEKRFILG